MLDWPAVFLFSLRLQATSAIDLTRPRRRDFRVASQPQFCGYSKRSKMIIDLRQECTDFVARSVRKTASWRESNSKRWPGDDRNLKAADRLNGIADEATELSDYIWDGLKPYFHWSDERFAEAVSQTSRNVVFRHDIKNFDAYTRSLLGVVRAAFIN
jgi:hypothetical protein